MNKKILIIEDDDILANLTADSLNSKDFDTTICNDSTSAKQALKGYYDLILLDINLPNATGFELCDYIRAKTKTPIIFMSARTSVTDKTHALDIGCDDYLEKPYSIDELVSRINAVLRRSTVSEIVKFGDITIDLLARKVWKANSELRLANKEFELLKFLVENKNQSISKEKLFIRIWGEYAQTEESSLQVHIRWLREKLEDEPSKPKYLKTVHGFGYMLVIE